MGMYMLAVNLGESIHVGLSLCAHATGPNLT